MFSIEGRSNFIIFVPPQSGRMEIKMKKLPIKIDSLVKTECWTQYLLSIVQTSELSDAWVASHFQLCGIDDGGAWYGTSSKILSYKDALDIINYEDVCIWTITPERIIPWIIEEINRDNYILVELMFKNGSSHRIHEMLLYGYDINEGCFFTPIINNNTQEIEETKIPFDQVLLMYKNLYLHFTNDANKDELISSLRCNYLISRISLRKDYKADGALYDFWRLLDSYLNGEIYDASQINSNFEIIKNKKIYCGISTMLSVIEEMDKIISERKFIEHDTDVIYNDLFGRVSDKLSRDIYKIYEHKKILLSSIIWFYSNMNTVTQESKELVEKFRKCCNSMKSYYKIAMKFQKKRDWDILIDLLPKFKLQYSTEYELLNQISNDVKECLYTQKSFSNYINSTNILPEC